MALTTPAPAPEQPDEGPAHVVDYDHDPASGDALECIDDCPGCAAERYEADCQTMRDAMKTATSECERSVYALDLYLLAHPEACHTDADYPGWTPGGAS